MSDAKTFWDHIQSLAIMSAEVPDQRLWLDSLVAELPGLEARNRQALRTQLQALLCTLPAITHLARDTGAAPVNAEAKAAPSKSTPIPYR
jgi:hypothetical protein